ncbi:MAG: hypothetical protein DRO99_03080 [Candidatus Aenigmatarchaeota archaeon]|nr:MAG: hypothetical protein DRO99_03080 [Candidatus Aenigmarchaeota archaeon]
MDGVAKYNDMVMVAGSAGHVLDHSFRMLDGRQFYHRLVGGSRQWRHSQEDMARTVACAGSSASRRA